MIPIDDHKLTTNNMIKQSINLMENVEAKIGNAKQPLFDCTEPYKAYYSDFGDTDDDEKNVLPYGEDIQYQKEVQVNGAYIESLDKYIGDKVFFPGTDSIPVLVRVKRKKRDDPVNYICEEHSNPIIDTMIYQL